MSEIIRINTCPMCGGDVSGLDPLSLTENKCPYCGYEIYNHSKEIYDEKIEDVKKAKSKLISVQLMIAIAAIIVIAIAGVFVAYKTVYRHTDKYITDEADKITDKMHKAYKNKDWDALYDMTIENFEVGIQSKYYYSYRAAWRLSYFAPIFDQATNDGNEDGMKDAFYQIRDEYEVREELEATNKQFKEIDDSLDDIYYFIPEIEEQLENEYYREKEILEKRGVVID